MRVIELDASNWKTPLDFYEAILAGLGAPDWHGRNLNALTESMIWGEINKVEAPYTVRIHAARNLPESVRSYIDLTQHELAEARADFRARRGRDVDVKLEIID